MKVGIIGSGGREHAICFFLKKSKKVSEIYCFPGNAGTNKIAKNIQVELNDFEKLKNEIVKHKIDLIIVGPEKPLVDGVVDYLEKNKIKVFGPNKVAAQLEGSKIFTKKLCQRYKIPTAKFGIFKNSAETLNFLNEAMFPTVIKADGLAGGKGVYICENISMAKEAVNGIFNGKFGIANEILVEEFLEGEEMSYFILTDGITYEKFQTAQDHKRILEGDMGKNTGGMGAYSPSKLINKELDNKILKKIIEPTLKALKKLGTNFSGFLYAGLMIKNNEPYLIEYNVRMGDPECQTILPRLKSDLMDLIINCVEGKLSKTKIEWYDDKSLCVVLCSKGYPDKFKNHSEIKNLNNLESIMSNDEFIFHAGTVFSDGKIFSNGGRVLNFVKKSQSFKKSRQDVLDLIENLNWENGFHRKDIGHKVID